VKFAWNIEKANWEDSNLYEKKKNSALILELAERFWQIRLLRFLAIGALNTLFSYVIYAVLILIGLSMVNQPT
jgi:hypothetical protein